MRPATNGDPRLEIWADNADFPTVSMSPPAWSGQPTKVNPGATLVHAGSVPGTQPAAETANWWRNRADGLVTYLDGVDFANISQASSLPCVNLTGFGASTGGVFWDPFFGKYWTSIQISSTPLWARYCSFDGVTWFTDGAADTVAGYVFTCADVDPSTGFFAVCVDDGTSNVGGTVVGHHGQTSWTSSVNIPFPGSLPAIHTLKLDQTNVETFIVGGNSTVSARITPCLAAVPYLVTAFGTATVIPLANIASGGYVGYVATVATGIVAGNPVRVALAICTAGPYIDGTYAWSDNGADPTLTNTWEERSFATSTADKPTTPLVYSPTEEVFCFGTATGKVISTVDGGTWVTLSTTTAPNFGGAPWNFLSLAVYGGVWYALVSLGFYTAGSGPTTTDVYALAYSLDTCATWTIVEQIVCQGGSSALSVITGDRRFMLLTYDGSTTLTFSLTMRTR